MSAQIYNIYVCVATDENKSSILEKKYIHSPFPPQWIPNDYPLNAQNQLWLFVQEHINQ